MYNEWPRKLCEIVYTYSNIDIIFFKFSLSIATWKLQYADLWQKSNHRKYTICKLANFLHVAKTTPETPTKDVQLFHLENQYYEKLFEISRRLFDWWFFWNTQVLWCVAVTTWYDSVLTKLVYSHIPPLFSEESLL